jgi:hypothetical protein
MTRIKKRQMNRISYFKLRTPAGNGLKPFPTELRAKFWVAQRTMTRRMPSSIREKAQSSIDPKATGVKMKRIIRIS